jgi:hypothetical protein
MNYLQQNRFLFLSLLFLGLLSSCKTLNVLPDSKPIENVSLKRLTKKINAATPSFKNFRSRLRVTYNDGKREQQLNVALRMSSSKTIWMSATMLIPIAKLMITPTELQFYEKFQKTYFKGELDFINTQFNTDFRYEELQNILMGIPAVDLERSRWKQVSHPSLYVLTSASNELPYQPTLFFNPSDFRVTEQRFFIPGTANVLSIKYPEYQRINNKVIPKRIELSYFNGQQLMSIAFDLTRADFPSKITFPFSVPKGYQSIQL